MIMWGKSIGSDTGFTRMFLSIAERTSEFKGSARFLKEAAKYRSKHIGDIDCLVNNFIDLRDNKVRV